MINTISQLEKSRKSRYLPRKEKNGGRGFRRSTGICRGPNRLGESTESGQTILGGLSPALECRSNSFTDFHSSVPTSASFCRLPLSKLDVVIPYSLLLSEASGYVSVIETVSGWMWLRSPRRCKIYTLLKNNISCC